MVPDTIGAVVFATKWPDPAPRTFLAKGREALRALQLEKRLGKDEILVARMTSPDWVPVMRHAGALVTDDGGMTCHAAIVSRELGVPAIVGCGNATHVLHDQQEITVSCAEGDEGFVYEGIAEFTVEEIKADMQSSRAADRLRTTSPPSRPWVGDARPRGGRASARSRRR